jgi:hypothetical protein
MEIAIIKVMDPVLKNYRYDKCNRPNFKKIEGYDKSNGCNFEKFIVTRKATDLILKNSRLQQNKMTQF